jgi:hypothetical protein
MTRMRSPNYPGIPLKHAVDLTDKIFRADRTNAIDREVAAEHMGYSGLTGRTLKLLGALSQFGLLEKVGKGKVRVSPIAVSILHGIDDDEKHKALLTAATSPALFKRIRDAFDQPSEKTITSFLMKEGFTDAAVGPVLKSYAETNSFLAASGVTESYGKGLENEKESSLDHDDLEDDDMQADEIQPAPATVKLGNPISLASYQEGPLDYNLSTTGLRLSGTTNSATELKAFIAKLTLLAGLLPDVPSDSGAASE